MDYEDNANYSKIAGALTPEQFAKGKDVVSMEFEKEVLLTPVHGTTVRYTKGVHPVPAQFRDHWYLRANGARIYNKPVAPAPALTSAADSPGPALPAAAAATPTLAAAASDSSPSPKAGKKKAQPAPAADSGQN